MSRFEGAERYVATEDLKIAVNADIALEQIGRASCRERV